MSMTDEPILVMDFENRAELPRNFRSTKGGNPVEAGAPLLWSGWDRLNASAAGQFSELSLVTSLEHMPGQVYIVDLRQESHGFVNGIPVSWYGLRNQANVGKGPREIAHLEEGLVADLASRGTIALNKILRKGNGRLEETEVREITVERAETERQLVEGLGLFYVRLPVTDHQHPRGPTVEQLVDFWDNLPGNAWVHFHCRGGKGRSSTLMVLYDIYHNGGVVSLEEIIRRNASISSKDLTRISDLGAKQWKNEMARQRHQFIEDFYSYMVDPGGYGQLRWTDWLGERGSADVADRPGSAHSGL